MAQDLKLYRGMDCHCCGQRRHRKMMGGSGGNALPGLAPVAVCVECDLTPQTTAPSWPESRPPASS